MLRIAPFRRVPPRHLRPVRWCAAAALTVLTVLAASGCGISRLWTSPPSPGQAIQDAASSAAAMKSADVNFTTQVNGLTVMSGTVREELTPTRLATLSMTAVDGAEHFNVTEIVTKSNVYLSVPALAAASGKPWVGVPVSRLTADPALMQLYQTNTLPTAEAGLLGTARTARLAGKATVGGVATSRYVGVISPATALEHVAPGVRQLLAPELASTTGMISFAVWIDAQHNFRKIQTSAMIANRPTVTTVVFTATNQAVHIEVPQSSQVVVTTS